jgi:zinc protease
MKRLSFALTALLLAASPAAAHPPAGKAPAPKAVTSAPGTMPIHVSRLGLPHSGAPLYALRDSRLPRVWWHLYLEAGERFVPARLAGMSSVAADLLDQGPAGIPLATYRQDLFRRGAAIQWEATNRFLIAHVKCRPDQLEAMAALVRRTAAEPRLAGGEFERARDRVLTLRRALDDDMRQATFLYGKQKLFGFRPEARMPEGWPKGIQAIGREDLAGWLKTHLAHPAAFVAAAGPVTPYRLAGDVGPGLGAWLRPYRGGRAAMPPAPEGRRVVLIDKPGATDNQIYMLTPLAVDLTSPAAPAAEVFFAGMGRDLGSRLGNALRVKRGLTYGANAGFRPMEWPSWYFYSFGGMTQTPQIVAGAFELFGAAKGGLTAAEVAKAKDQLVQDRAGALETPPEQIEAVAGAVALGLPADLPFRAPGRLAAVTPAQAAVPAAAAAGLDRALIVVMGDAGKLREPLEKALPAGTAIEVKSFEAIEAEALAAR